MGEHQGWKVGAMGESLGEMTSSPIFFAPDCERKLWANASKQKGVIQNLNFTIYQNWKYYFRRVNIKTYYVLNIIKLRVYYT